MISFAEPLPIGNAVRILLDPPVGAVKWRVLRKTTDDFVGYNDPDAKLVYDGTEKNVVDTATLTNGTQYFYREYALVGTDWVADESIAITPATAYGFDGADVLTLVRERLRLGLKAAVAAHTLNHKSGAIPVYTAPPVANDETPWPLVTVHLEQDASEGRGLAEMLADDVFDPDAQKWDVSEGWLSRVRLQIIGWSLNPDERITLRRTIRLIVQGNLPVFDAAGMVQIDFSQVDVEDFQSYNAPVYQAIGALSCLAPSVINAMQDIVEDVTVDAEGS